VCYSRAMDTDFEAYLENRRRTGKILLAVGAALFVAIIAVPYALMHGGVIKKDIFEIFVVGDVLLGAGIARAGMMRLWDKAGVSMPFS
jgi:hypothetical protein